MIWPYLFGVSVAQGIFILTIFLIRTPRPTISGKLIITIVIAFIITSLDYFFVTSKLSVFVPRLFGMSFGLMLLLGPLFYFYCKSLTDNSFSWQRVYWLHFLPYAVNLSLQIPFYIIPNEIKFQIISAFLTGTLPFRNMDLVMISLQSVHLISYLIASIHYTRKQKEHLGNVQYIVSGLRRLKWLNILRWALIAFSICIIAFLIITMINRKFVPELNFLYTLLTTVILYIVAMRIVLQPEIIEPGFSRKYQNSKNFDEPQVAQIVEKINFLFNQEKIFLDPDFKLNALAKHLQIPAHQLSMLINDRFGKSFSEMVNEKRVEEFIRRVNESQYANYSLYGIALDVGFNSKSSFNLIFKKVTGRTPGEYKSVSKITSPTH